MEETGWLPRTLVGGEESVLDDASTEEEDAGVDPPLGCSRRHAKWGCEMGGHPTHLVAHGYYTACGREELADLCLRGHAEARTVHLPGRLLPSTLLAVCCTHTLPPVSNSLHLSSRTPPCGMWRHLIQVVRRPTVARQWCG
jgi:hypothetical protein